MLKIDPVDYLYTFIKNKPTVPRWFIFILDVFICSTALVYSYLLRFNFQYDVIRSYNLLIPVTVVSLLNIFFFILFRTYEGIIRLSGAREAIICVSAVFSTTVAVLISNGISALFHWSHLVPFSIMIIYFFTASFVIFSYRILIKEIYHRSLNSRLKAEKVIVYGISRNGALLKKAIESIAGRQYKIIAFADDNTNLRGKSIDSIKIYSLEQAKCIAICISYP